MFWVIQENVAGEERHDHFVQAVERLGDDYALVKVIPFSNEVIPDINPQGDVMVIGSVRLTQKIAPSKGWTSFINDNFDFEVWRDKWKGHILNEDAIVAPFRSIPVDKPVFFIRPCKDNKAFTGTVMDLREYQTWLGRLLANEQASDLDFDIDEMVLVSSVKNIQREVRFFIVDGKPVTHSTYRIGRQTKYLDDIMTDPIAVQFVQDMINIWTPTEAFVLDIALVEDEYKIIEINCLNCAGFYKADVFKIVEAIDALWT